jgi:hypothetical protein
MHPTPELPTAGGIIPQLGGNFEYLISGMSSFNVSTVAAVSEEIIHPVSGEQVLSTQGGQLR